MSLIRPLNDGVVVEPFDLADKSDGGVIMPDTAKRRSNEGIVRAVGRGHWDHNAGAYRPLDVEVGQRVLFLRWTGYAVVIDGQKLISLKEHEILCEVDKNADVELVGELKSNA